MPLSPEMKAMCEELVSRPESASLRFPANLARAALALDAENQRAEAAEASLRAVGAVVREYLTATHDAGAAVYKIERIISIS